MNIKSEELKEVWEIVHDKNIGSLSDNEIRKWENDLSSEIESLYKIYKGFSIFPILKMFLLIFLFVLVIKFISEFFISVDISPSTIVLNIVGIILIITIFYVYAYFGDYFDLLSNLNMRERDRIKNELLSLLNLIIEISEESFKRKLFLISPKEREKKKNRFQKQLSELIQTDY